MDRAVTERAALEAVLDRQRDTLLATCAGLTPAQLATPAVPTSTLSLLGLVRHLTDVERAWFRRRAAGEAVGPAYPDAFEGVDPARAEADLAALRAEWALCRRAVAGLPLAATFVHERRGVTSLRWVYCHLVEEYARHNGHADLIRLLLTGRSWSP
jgi:hypothetical protein